MDWDVMVLGNSVSAWLSALGVFLAINIALAAAKWGAISRLSRLAGQTSTSLDDAAVEIARRTHQTLIVLVSLYLASRYLILPDRLLEILHTVAIIAAFLQLGRWISAALFFWLGRYGERAAKTNASAATTIGALAFVGQLALWSVVLLLALDNLGVDVTALVTGLGVGGIAVALAVQNILGDLFASLSIIIDKPFVIGDFITVGDYSGTVENVGLKTTRLRSLSGEQIVFSNSDLLASRIRNYKRMYERRVAFTFGLHYQTTPEQLESIPQMVERIVRAQPVARFERAHFSKFGESSFDFEVVYWMTDPDYNLYMDVQQTVNLAMIRSFSSAGIHFANPTRTIVMDGPLPVQSVATGELTGASGAELGSVRDRRA
jgi:small-conductance mechanosensitive channel